MAQLLSQFVYWQAIFQLMGGIGMTQAMDTAYLFNASFVFGFLNAFCAVAHVRC